MWCLNRFFEGEWNIARQVGKGRTVWPEEGQVQRPRGVGSLGCQKCGYVRECITFLGLPWIKTTENYSLTVPEARHPD